MKISSCCSVKMIKHSQNGSYICSKCGYAASIINTAGSKYRREKIGKNAGGQDLIKYIPVKPKKEKSHYPTSRF